MGHGRRAGRVCQRVAGPGGAEEPAPSTIGASHQTCVPLPASTLVKKVILQRRSPRVLKRKCSGPPQRRTAAPALRCGYAKPAVTECFFRAHRGGTEGHGPGRIREEGWHPPRVC